jgi:hypothetical protein
MKLRNRKLAVVAFALIATSLGACSLQRPAANEWGCSFGKGPWDTKALKETRAPGSDGDWTNDNQVTGPSDIRFYIVDSDPNTADFGGRPIEVPAKGSVETGVGVVTVSVEAQVRLMFNENFCDWYIKHGKRNEPLNYSAKSGEESGWNTFLNSSVNQKLIEGARPIVANQSYVDLYVNAPIGDELAYDVLAKQLSANLSRELERDLGGSYFCGPSYKFDGEIDGELSTGCPPLEVTIKRIVPKDPALIQRLEQIVSNEEQQKLISSNQERQLAEIASEEALAERDQERRQAVETAQAEAEQVIGEANAARDLAIARAEQQVEEQNLTNSQIAAQADAAFCQQLAAQGVDCAWYKAAESGGLPNVILNGEGTGLDVLIPTDPNE